LANSKSAAKRARQNTVRREHNLGLKSRMRTFVKKVLAAIASGDKAAATESYKEAVPVIDGAASKGLIHANKAARHKSRLNNHIKNMA
jgi:small subunit ribosomal protein S20